MASNFLRLTLIGRDQSASSTVDALTKKIRTAGDTISGIGSKVSGAGRDLSVGVTAPLVGIAALGVKTEADFSRTMAQVAVATNLPSTKLKGLTDYALEMGAKTSFSASEAAAAMLNLAKGGFTPAQIKGGALAATMNLAAAGGLNLDDAATDVVASMNTFNIKAEDAGKITAALAGAANASSADVSDLAMALSQGGAAARATKQPLADAAGFLALLADNGIKGSDAGTSMKTFLLNLVPQSKQAKDAMKDLDLSFVNADGSIKKLPAVAEELRSKFAGLSDAQRIAAEKTIFGTDAFRAAESLYQSGPAKLAAYTKAAKDQTAATKMANAQMSGTAGAIERMRGSLETAALTIGVTLAPTVQMLAGKLQALADWFSKLDGDQRKTIVTILAVAAAIGPMLFVTGKLISGVGATVTAFANARTAATNFGAGLRSAQAAGSAATGLAGSIGGAVRTVVGGFLSGTAAAARWAAATVAAGARAAAGAVAAGARTIASLAAQGAAYVAAGARAAASTGAQLAVRGAQLAMAAATGIATAAQWLLNAAMTANPIGIVVVAIAALVAGLVWFFSQTKVGQQIWAGFVGFLQSAWAGFTAWIGTAINAVVGFFRQWGPLILAVVAPFIGLPLLIISKWSTITAWFGKLPGLIGGLVAGAGRWLVDAGAKVLIGMRDGAVNGLLTFGRWALGIQTAVLGWLAGAGRWLLDSGVKLLTGMRDGAVNGLLGFGRWMIGIQSTVIGWLAGAANWLVQTGAKLLLGFATGARNNMTALSAWATSLPGKILGWLGNVAGWLVSAGRNVIQGLVNGITGGVTGLMNTVRGIADNVVSTAMHALDEHSPSKKFVQIGRWLTDGWRIGIAGGADDVIGVTKDLANKIADLPKKTWARVAGGKSGFLKALEVDTSALIKLARRRDALGESLKAAQDNLEDAIKTRNDYRSSVSSSAMAGGDVASAFTTARQDATDAASQANDLQAKIADLDDTVSSVVDNRQTILDKLDNVREREASASTVAGRTAAANQILTLTQQLTDLDQRVSSYQDDRAALVAKMSAADSKAKSSPVAILVDNLKAQVGKVNQFKSLLTSLKAQGLDDTTYAQLVGAGVDQGLSTAQALAADGAGAVGQIASLQSQLATASDRLGFTTSQQLYQAGVDSARALRDGLQGQVAAVTGAMGVVQQDMATSIAKLGIDTSGMMRQAGRDIADGLTAGLKDRQKALDKVLDDIGGRMETVLRKKTKTHSPSRMSWGIADDWMAGLGGGLKAGMPQIDRIVAGLIPTEGYKAPVTVGATGGSGAWGSGSNQGSNAPMLNIEHWHAGEASAHELLAELAWVARKPA